MFGVIIAGGRGTRFWPSSRKNNPKQLLDIIGPDTMLQMTIDRLKKINSLEIKIKAKVGEGVKLFGSVNNINVQKELAESGVEIDKKSIMISGNNIKQTGKYTAKIRLHREVIFDFPFEVVPEKK